VLSVTIYGNPGLTVNNPFENESTFLSTKSRKEQRRKGKKPRSKRLKTEEHEDAEIQAEIDMEIQQHGGENVRIISDSDPR
jgi:hypothetical protein